MTRPMRPNGPAAHRLGPKHLVSLKGLMDFLPANSRQELLDMAMPESAEAGTTIIADGATVDQIGFLCDGLLGLIKILPDRRRHIIGILAPFDVFGRIFDGPSPVEVEALSDVELLRLPRDRFEGMLQRFPEAERLFLAGLLKEVDAAREWVLVMGKAKVVQRLAAFLLFLGRHDLRGVGVAQNRSGHSTNVKIAIDRQTLSQFLGARHESLSRAFHELADDHIIRINSPYDVDILNMAALVAASG